MEKKTKDSELINNSFNSVKQLMEKGYPKYKACKKLGIDRFFLQKNLTIDQKRILDEIFFCFSKGSTESRKISGFKYKFV